MAIGNHVTRWRLCGGNHRHGARGMAFIHVFRIGGIQNIEAKIQISSTIGDFVCSLKWRLSDLDI